MLREVDRRFRCQKVISCHLWLVNLWIQRQEVLTLMDLKSFLGTQLFQSHRMVQSIRFKCKSKICPRSWAICLTITATKVISEPKRRLCKAQNSKSTAISSSTLRAFNQWSSYKPPTTPQTTATTLLAMVFWQVQLTNEKDAKWLL